MIQALHNICVLKTETNLTTITQNTNMIFIMDILKISSRSTDQRTF